MSNNNSLPSTSLPPPSDSALTSSSIHLPSTSNPSPSSNPIASLSSLSHPGSSAQMASNIYRPLNVRDALSYLDQVKLQFHDSPGVYNKFLDIMKDFKTQMIDTPGVIDGVSSLFRGHPALIQGFNTFLPPGYRIDVSQGEGSALAGVSSDYSLITVTHPMGVQTQKRVPLQSGGEESGSHVVPDSVAARSFSAGPVASEKQTHENLISNSPSHSHSQKPPLPLPDNHVPSSSSTSSAKPKPMTLDAIATHNRINSPAPSLNPGSDASKSTVKPLEFNHAITYVNKIKNRYAGDPKTYQSFLDILQTYQRDARPIQEVYEQVNQLFRGAPDLLVEFMQFLPDTSGAASQLSTQGTSVAVPTALSAPPTDPSLGSNNSLHRSSTPLPSKRNGRETQNGPAAAHEARHPHATGAGSNPNDQANASLQPPPKKRRHAATAPANTNLGPSNEHPFGGGSLDLRQQALFPDPGASRLADLNGDSHRGQASPGRGLKRKPRGANKTAEVLISMAPATGLPPPGFAPAGYATIGEAYHAALTTNEALSSRKRKSRLSSRQPGPPDREPPPRARPAAMQSSAKEELMFFHKLKTYFEDQSTYIELLKLINLFTQDLIDLRTLVGRVKPFLSNCPELFARFAEIVGWREEPAGVSAGAGRGHLASKKRRVRPEANTRPVLFEQERTPECGPSYRRLPDAELSAACSGRDGLCWEVLNDALVCGPPGPTMDEQVFMPRQANAFERALYQTEDERHEYDYHIEANVRTIALLEPINLRIQQMDPPTRAEYRLKPGLGGQCKSVYQRIIKKIYGKEHGLEVIEALHDNPALAVPIVLGRLKQKDEEWKKALREWNRVWREVDGKNYWKALDHQGISFKMIDKKMIGNKNLLNEIELIKREQQQRRKLLLNPSMVHYLPKHQLELEMVDQEVFYDILKVFIHFLDHVPNSTGLDDALKDQIEGLLKSILVSFFDIPLGELERHLTPLPAEKKGVQDGAGSGSNCGKNTDGDANETVYSEGDGSDTAGSTAQPGGLMDERTESAGRPSRGASGSGRKRGQARESGGGAGAGDLRKKAMKNASNCGPAGSERAAARRSEAGRGRGRRSSPGPGPTDESSSQRAGGAGLETESGVAEGRAGEIETSAVREETCNVKGAGSGEPSVPGPSQASCSSNTHLEPGRLQRLTNEASNDASKPPSIRIELDDSAGGVGLGVDEDERGLSFFANNGFYCLFRLLHILYTRFKTLKQASMESVGEDGGGEDMVRWPSGRTGSSLPVSPSIGWGMAVGSLGGAYGELLESVQKFNGGEIEQGVFEEECRRLFGVRGFVVVTIDKVCLAVVKVLLKIYHDESSQEILKLYSTFKKTAYSQQQSQRQPPPSESEVGLKGRKRGNSRSKGSGEMTGSGGGGSGLKDCQRGGEYSDNLRSGGSFNALQRGGGSLNALQRGGGSFNTTHQRAGTSNTRQKGGTFHTSRRAGLNEAQRLGYRRDVEGLLGGSGCKLFRIEWVRKIGAIRIQLIGSDDICSEDFEAMELAWGRYVESFGRVVQDEEQHSKQGQGQGQGNVAGIAIEVGGGQEHGRTVGVEGLRVREPFLKRNVKVVKGSFLRLIRGSSSGKGFDEGDSMEPKELDVRGEFYSRSGLGIRICMRSYRMFFSPNTGEWLVRKRREEKKEEKGNNEKQNEKGKGKEKENGLKVRKESDVGLRSEEKNEKGKDEQKELAKEEWEGGKKNKVKGGSRD